MMFGSCVAALLRFDDVVGFGVVDPWVVEGAVVDWPGEVVAGIETLSLGPAWTAGRVDDAATDSESVFAREED
jgi:hypothetical protein